MEQSHNLIHHYKERLYHRCHEYELQMCIRDRDFDSVPYVVNFWLNHNSIPQSSETITPLNGGVGTKTEYTGGNGNTDFTLYKIDQEYGKEGGHVWFGDAINGKIPGQIMWDFLSNYTTND